MSDNLMHATLVEIAGQGVLLTGKSSSGKSDLALRLIENKNAVLVADDIVELQLQDGIIIGRAPHNLKGLLEVRGVGVIEFPYKNSSVIKMVVRLQDDFSQIERMPKNRCENILGLEIVQIDLYAKENSAPDKVITALKVFVTKELRLEE